MLKKILKNKFINEFLYRTMYLPKKIVMFFELLRFKKRNESGSKIKVVLMVQFPSLWGKLELLYNELIKHDEFDVVLLAIPDYNYETQTIEYSTMENKAYEFLKNENLAVVKANTESGWLDLSAQKIDYIFFPRPYDALMPNGYKSSDLIKYMKTCYIPYGYSLGKSLMRNSFHLRFFTNLYFYFAENKDFEKYNRRRFMVTHLLNLRKSVYVGYPSLQKVLENKVEECRYWKKDNNTLNIMWTPRWTVNEAQGTSSFFKYKDALLNQVKNNDNLSLVARPHPLAFSNFIEIGLMSENEVDDYKKQFDNKRLFLDQHRDYQPTMWCSDVLITDFSSIIIEYFIMNKPIIYCESDVEPTPTFQKILDVSYIAKDYEDIKKYLDHLEKGIDPLKERREKMIQEICDIQQNLETSKYIVELLKKDRR